MRVRACLVAPAVVVLWLSAAVESQAAYSYEALFDLPIPAAPGATRGWMADAVLAVPDHVLIADLDAAMDVTHTNVFDLQLFLQGPSGTTVLLNMYDPSSGYVNGDDYSQTIFDDEAAISIQDGSAPFTGRFRPLGTLSAFDGQEAYGLWRLQIYDAFFYDTGQLNQFGLFVTTPTMPTPTIPAPTALTLVLIGLGLIGRSKRRITGKAPHAERCNAESKSNL